MEKNLASANICSTFSFTYQLDNFCITIKMYSRRFGRIRNRRTTLSTPLGHAHTQKGGVAWLIRREEAVDKPASKSWTRFMCFARLCDNKTKQNKTEHKLRLEMAGHSYDSRGRVYDTGSRTLPSRHKY